MQYRNEIRAWIRSHEKDMIADLEKLIAVPSVMGASQERAPFGEQPLAALQLMLEKARDVHRFLLRLFRTAMYILFTVPFMTMSHLVQSSLRIMMVQSFATYM